MNLRSRAAVCPCARAMKIVSVASHDSILMLTIETATRAGSVCLARGKHIIAARTGDSDVSHSAHLLQHIEELFAEANFTIQDVELFAAATGPGSFTGLRIGLSTLKAFAAMLQRPCAGIPTLHAVAHAAGCAKRTVAMLPAGRGEVFWQMFETSEHRVVRALSKAGHIKPQELTEQVAAFRTLAWAGEGARLYAAWIKERAQRENLAFVDDAFESIEKSGGAKDNENVWRLAAPVTNLAAHVSALALERYRVGEVCEAKDLQAIYVRLSDAEIKQQCTV